MWEFKNFLERSIKVNIKRLWTNMKNADKKKLQNKQRKILLFFWIKVCEHCYSCSSYLKFQYFLAVKRIIMGTAQFLRGIRTTSNIKLCHPSTTISAMRKNCQTAGLSCVAHGNTIWLLRSMQGRVTAIKYTNETLTV